LARGGGAAARRSSRLALADVDFGDAAWGGIGRDHAAGRTALAIALGVDDGGPFSGLELDRFAGRAFRRTAIALRPALEGTDGAGTRSIPRPARRIGPAGGEDFGQAHEQHAQELAAVRDRHAPTRSRLGAWTLVRGTAADTLTDLLASGAEQSG